MRDRVYGFSCYWSGFSVFLWLALVVAGDPQGLPITGVPQGTSVGVTNAGSADFITRYIISIGLLLAGLRVASEVGGSAAHIVGKGNANWLQVPAAYLLGNIWARRRLENGQHPLGTSGWYSLWSGQKRGESFTSGMTEQGKLLAAAERKANKTKNLGLLANAEAGQALL